MSETTQVYQAINHVQSAIAKIGISKDRNNSTQHYAFRGIDDIYNSLSNLLAEHKLCILPDVKSITTVERTSKNGGALFYTTVHVGYSLISSEDGSTHSCSMYGEAMDSGDKATNKAMSAAYKYLCLQVFCIPTEGDNDADASTHVVLPTYAQLVATHQDTINAIIQGIKNKDLSTAAEAWYELDEDTQKSLWKAESKGGCFTTEEQRIIKTTEFIEAHFGNNQESKL